MNLVPVSAGPPPASSFAAPVAPVAAAAAALELARQSPLPEACLGWGPGMGLENGKFEVV